uniref:Mitochondrial translational initiation factor 3 n=1 Tax=Sphenodon punctatus TaxID=8508 RepID=A0A8D0L4F8_SPHPU
MAAVCVRKLTYQALRNEASCITRHFGSLLVQTMQKTTLSQSWVRMDWTKKELVFIPTKAFGTLDETKGKPVGEKTNAQISFENVGRKIPHRLIQIIDENGENQGIMHRVNVIKIMDERNVKLVLLQENADPPVYRLMTGKQLHEERLKFKEKEKASPKTGTTQPKELTLSTVIGKHDFETKIKHIQQWIDDKHHVKITLWQKNVANGPEEMLAFFGRILEKMPGKATYVSTPKVVREGRSICVLRHMSDKEIHQYHKMEKDKHVPKENGNKTESYVLHQ